MDRVVIIGAGLYGLITAKTYLQVAGNYDHRDEDNKSNDSLDGIPNCFTAPKDTLKNTPGTNLLVLDAASDIGGTWAKDRLYPNLLSQNSYGLYEFSDLPLTEVVPQEESGVGRQFIAGWKINKYLHAWVAKWRLRKHIRLGWKVETIRRLESKEWEIHISRSSTPGVRLTLICDKLILATGLTSVPNYPDVSSAPQTAVQASTPIIHAKDIGDWAGARLGYQPMPDIEIKLPPQEMTNANLRSVTIYGGAKSSFDLVHFFATLHRKDPALHLAVAPKDPVQVHWIIREKGTGPAWMAPPTSALPNGEVVASDKAASSRFLHYLTPCSYEIPKRYSLRSAGNNPSRTLRVEGSWLARLFHGNPLGRWWIRWFWKSVDLSLIDLAQYETEEKMRLLRPNKSVISCGASIGIANQADLWETIRSSQVEVHRSTITDISTASQEADGHAAQSSVSLADGSRIEGVDLIVYATGYKPIVPIKFNPPTFRLQLGLSGLASDAESELKEGMSDSCNSVTISMDSTTDGHLEHWQALDNATKPEIRQTLIANGCVPMDDSRPSWTGNGELLPYRLFRRMVAPQLVAEGDRSFATVGVVLTSTIAVVAEVQALWVTAFLTGGFDQSCSKPASRKYSQDALRLNTLSRAVMEKTVSEDVVLGSLTGTGLEVDAILYNDILMRDLGLNPYRLGGGFIKELTGVYEPSVYAGIVDEWRESQGCTPSRS